MMYLLNILLCLFGVLLNVVKCNYNSDVTFKKYFYSDSINIINAFLIASAIIMINPNINYVASISIGYTINSLMQWMIKK